MLRLQASGAHMNAATPPIAADAFGAAQDRGWLDTRLAFAMLCLAAIAPLLVVDFPPLVDLYGHLGRYAVQTDLHNRPGLQQYFSYEWTLIGNLGADLLVQLLHRWLGLETAVRCIVIVTQLLAATGVLLVSRELHGRITPFAIAALPLIYGLAFNYGFLNFSLSMALAMLAFVVWLRLHRRGNKLVPRVWLGLAGMAIWVCHAYGWAFLGLLCGSALLADAITGRQRPLAALGAILAECWPLLLPLVPMTLWRSGTGGLSLMGWSLSFKLQGLASVFRHKWVILDTASLFVAISLIYWAIRSKSAAFDLRLGIAALVCLASFMVLPVQVFGSMYADIRLAPYILMTALLAVSPRKLGAQMGRVLGLIALAFFAARMVTTGAAYLAHEKTVSEVLPTIDAIPQGSRVAFFVVVPCTEAWDLPVLSHVAGVALARRDVFANNHWQAAGVNPLIVHYPAAAPFERDPSQYVYAGECAQPVYPTLSKVLEQFPHPGFSHLWILGPLPDELVVPQGLEPVRHAGKGALYAVNSPQ
ncbi:MAG: hypothetical protein EDM03_16300 [Porphyrobacter sp. IPPAS B-1204]|nr:MAG: hypothetical protein EDM03_16300 [Porphyrobacter sp. IPPAS B-1204]